MQLMEKPVSPGNNGFTPFVLWGRNAAITHSDLVEGTQNTFTNNLQSFGDPVMRGIWRQTPVRFQNPGGLTGHIEVLLERKRYLYLYGDLEPVYGYPVTTGLYIRAKEFG